jgi:LDH2 family malate/lactate/ureidoglycolate dehydrogenase
MGGAVQAGRLTEFAVACLRGVGSSVDEARIVAEHLVSANLAGHDSHGIGVLPLYVEHALDGRAVPNAGPVVAMDNGAVIRIDGRGGFGAVTGRFAIEEGATRAKAHGVALVLTGNTHHLGRIGGFAEQAAALGLASISFVNVTGHRGIVAPWRGREGKFGTNPVTVGMPATPGHGPAILDMATSQIAIGKARVAIAAGKRVPFGSLLDEHGDPTDDPSGMGWGETKGALTPFGEHKGYALAFMAELLGGALTGAGTIQPETPRDGGVRNGMTTVLIDPAACGDWSAMAAEIDAFTDYCLDCRPQREGEPVLAPGDPERIARAARGESGIAIDDFTRERLNAAAAQAGVGERL